MSKATRVLHLACVRRSFERHASARWVQLAANYVNTDAAALLPQAVEEHRKCTPLSGAALLQAFR